MPTKIPHIKDILTLGPTSLSIQWTLPGPEDNEEPEEVEGYFVYYRTSSTAGDYNKITIFGEGTHSHVIDHLEPGRQYDIKVSCCMAVCQCVGSGLCSAYFCARFVRLICLAPAPSP